MPLHRPTITWLACLAVLLHLLVMPLSGAVSVEEKRLQGWGGFCHSAQSLQMDVPLALAKLGYDLQGLDQGADDSSSKHGTHEGLSCCCGAGSASLAALPPSLPPVFGLAAPLERPAQPLLAAITLRDRWPSLHPRASPLA